MLPLLPMLGMFSKVTVYVLVIGGIFLGGVWVGNEWGSRALPKYIAKQALEEKKITKKREKITAQSDKHYIFLKGETKKVTDHLIIRVPEYVKDTCPLSPDFRLFHDYAAEGKFPLSPTKPLGKRQKAD